jgi:protein-tyrosine phosphatase
MDEVRPWLFIGKYRDTLDKAYLLSKSIDAMLELAEKVEQPGIVSLYLPVEDLAPIPFALLTQGITFVREHKKQRHRVLVACGAGINRSSAFSLAALKEEEELGLFEAFLEVKKKHSESLPHGPVWESLCSYYNETISYMDVMRVKI